MNNVRKFWETCRANYAHLRNNWTWDKESYRKTYFEDTFLNHINFENKTVIDYGCGGGYLGIHLFENYGIKKYIGIDIADRSLITTRKNLDGYNFEAHMTPIDFCVLGADVFITLATMQHFPDEKYLRLFLKNINESEISKVVLHIRHGENDFNDAYNNPINKGRACMTNSRYISQQLSNYTLISKSEVTESDSQVITYDYTG